MKDHVATTVVQTLKALNLVENNENQNPNTDYLASQNDHIQPSPFNLQMNPLCPSVDHHMFAATNNADPTMMQMLQQMTNMQNQIAALTMSNKSPLTNKTKNVNGDINPKTGKP